MPGAYQGRAAKKGDPWREVYRLAFSSLADDAGGTSDAGTMSLGGVTWTRRNNGGSYLDSLSIASGKLVWNLNGTSSLTNPQSAATGPLLRTLFNNISSELTSSVEPRVPIRFAAAVTDLGDENTEVIGIGCMGGSGGTANGFVLETGFIGGSAKTQWHSYSTSKLTNGSPVSGFKTALMLQMQGARAIPYYGTATAGGEPPNLVDRAEWTVVTPMTMTPYHPANNGDFVSNSLVNGQAVLIAANGNTNNNFAPAHTGIAFAVPDRYRLT